MTRSCHWGMAYAQTGEPKYRSVTCVASSVFARSGGNVPGARTHRLLARTPRYLPPAVRADNGLRASSMVHRLGPPRDRPRAESFLHQCHVCADRRELGAKYGNPTPRADWRSVDRGVQPTG